MPPLRNLFFDVGDTLVYDVPSVEERVWTASRECGIAYPRERLHAALRSAETYALGEYLQGRPPETPEIRRSMILHLLEHAGASVPSGDDLRRLGEVYAAIPFTRTLQPRALDLLKSLRERGFQLGIISDWDPSLEEMLRGMGVMEYMSAIAVSEIVGVTKPDPRLFQEALNQVPALPEESLHVGDFRELDIAGAHAAGMSAVLFDWRHREPDLEIAARVESFDALCDLLLSLPAPG
jgi:putative hydrolase of the HAD superfamily